MFAWRILRMICGKTVSEHTPCLLLGDSDLVYVVDSFTPQWSTASSEEDEDGQLVESLLREVLEVQTEKLGPDHSETLSARNHLALVLRRRGKLAEAEGLLRKVVESSTESPVSSGRLGADVEQQESEPGPPAPFEWAGP